MDSACNQGRCWGRLAGALAAGGVLLFGCSKEESAAPSADRSAEQAAVPQTGEAAPAAGAAQGEGGTSGAPGTAGSNEATRGASDSAAAAAPPEAGAAPSAAAVIPPPTEPPPPPPPAGDVFEIPKKLTKTRSGLQYALIKEGEGPLVKKGQQIAVHYTGWLKDGKKFDSSRGGRPFSFKVGEGMVIDGWEEAALLLHVGDKATLVIPAKLGYGAEGSPPDIPGNASLVFNIEVLAAR